MSTNKTTNLGLHSWVRSDKFSMDEFNENFDKLDQAVGEKAEKTALDAETTERQSALDTLAGRVGTLETGQLMYKIDKYSGKGTSGSGNKNKLTFDFSPFVVFVCPNSSGYSSFGSFAWVRGQSVGASGHSSAATVNLTWDEKSVSWYSNDVNTQMNSDGVKYYYLAIGLPV